MTNSHFKITEWVSAAPSNIKPFREAVHIILDAISSVSELQDTMVMKGGMLMALGYESVRYTKDIDFSTDQTPNNFNYDKFIGTIKQAIIKSSETLNYSTACRLQTYEKRPAGDDASFPTIRMKIGYADRNHSRLFANLMAGKSPMVIGLDYSLNEYLGDPIMCHIDDKTMIKTYSIEELIAEKYRALLQQKERHGQRRQDAYDINLLIQKISDLQKEKTKYAILRILKQKASVRDLDISKESMQDPEIIRKTEIEYPDIEIEVGHDDLPPFTETYKIIKHYYESLPWDT